ncbi:RNA polymerase sigma factor, partial [Kibdelosporangium lantanae]
MPTKDYLTLRALRTSGPMDEESVLRGVRDGEPDAQTRLYELCHRVVRTVAPLYRLSTYDKDDLHGEVYVIADSRIRAGKEIRSLVGWLTGVAKNTAAAHYRHAGREVLGDVPDVADPIVQPTVDDHIQLLESAIEALPGRLRPLMRTHLDLTRKHGQLVTGKKLANAMAWEPPKVYQQLRAGRQAAVQVMAAVDVARHCR